MKKDLTVLQPVIAIHGMGSYDSFLLSRIAVQTLAH
jgi:hypothetical protein